VFVTAADLLAEEHISLVADGLDTIAEIRLNGEIVARANNQFRRWRWEIGKLLRKGDNELTILFSGPTAYASREQERRWMIGASAGLDSAPHLRKAPTQSLPGSPGSRLSVLWTQTGAWSFYTCRGSRTPWAGTHLA